MFNFFGNRELAIIFWLSVFLIFSLSRKKVRKSSVQLVKTFFHHKIIASILLMTIYVELLVIGLLELGFWEQALLKDTVLWPIIVGFPLLLKLDKISGEENYLKTIFFDGIKGIVLIEFIANFYNFSLFAELIIIPVMSIIVISQVYTKDNPKYKPVDKLFKNLVTGFGIIVFINTCIQIYNGFHEFANIFTLKTLLLPIILTIAFIPFLYLYSLWSLYEILLLRTGHRLDKFWDRLYLHWKFFSTFFLNHSKLRKFRRGMEFEQIHNQADIKKVFNEFDK
ncbi:hypothetical protein EHW67_09510 [Arenibacter aquaticus]|uniref:EF-hand domain-containing protein n=1 Tax=Arenibacter aquaticus TaxID=2489054 RepID=A0A430K532_9FLAO|nr:hypothetical protein [Arenibacter aquaticus]RTE54149.1 hypothetical protein EHW67_09510 [Arenibacter aquaticus]